MKNNDNITKDVESISDEEIKLLKNEIHGLVIERDTLVKINQQLHDKLEAMRNENCILIEQIALKHDNTTCQYRMIRFADLSPADYEKEWQYIIIATDAALVRELTETNTKRRNHD